MYKKKMENIMEPQKPGPKKRFEHPLKVLSLHLPAPIYDQLQKMAAEQYPPQSMTYLIQLALMQFLTRRGIKLPERM
jgi:hypothetical protein